MKKQRRVIRMVEEIRYECETCGWAFSVDPEKPWQKRKAQSHVNETGHDSFIFKKTELFVPQSRKEPRIGKGDMVNAYCPTCARVVVQGPINAGFASKMKAHAEATGHSVEIHNAKA